MRVLITGARAPVAVEWAGIMHRHGHQVFLTDALSKPLGSFLHYIKYIPTPSPRFNYVDYQSAILNIIDQYNIDMIIPTCEEIYYLAGFVQQRPEVNWLMPDTELLYQLHNKYHVFGHLQGSPHIRLPDTRIITHPAQIHINSTTILKPLYSRFGSHIIRNVTVKAVESIEVSEHCPWVQQQKICGLAICNYAIFEFGKLKAHQVYRPQYCINDSAASAFQPIQNESIESFTQAFGQKLNYHGQISFDFITQSEDIFVIECNPRATSGLHIIAKECSSSYPQFKFSPTEKKTLHHLGSTMLFAPSIRNLLHPRAWQDYFSGINVMKNHKQHLPFYAQTSCLLELVRRAITHRQNLVRTSTFDIEWNGEPLNQ